MMKFFRIHRFELGTNENKFIPRTKYNHNFTKVGHSKQIEFMKGPLALHSTVKSCLTQLTLWAPNELSNLSKKPGLATSEL